MRDDQRLLDTLQRLLEIDEPELRPALVRASDLVAAACGAEKVDVFLARGDLLVAEGTSRTPMGDRQRALGLDRLPLRAGGRAAEVLRSGEPFLSRDSREDPLELPGLVGELGVRAAIFAPLDVGGERRGVLAVASARVGAFGEPERAFVLAATRWIAALTQRAELAERLARDAAEQGRRAAAEELVTVLAHDLRNVLGPVHGRVEILRERARREGRAADLRDADAAARSVARLTRLVDELLDVGRIEQGLFELQRGAVDLAALARETAGALALADRGVAVRAPDRLVVDGDGPRLRQVLDNLVANAVKHAPRGSEVEIEVEATSNGGARIAIRDRGPGIPPELLPTLFHRFARGAHSRGLGLGLYLAHEIVRAHGGTLAVESSPGAGTTFTIALPAGR